uniref:Uncharacterized protein n=1 Tax=Acanthochromis polyacanthus TaxID=80966 RepID=A0A3Q1GYU1_9TELE
MPERSPGKAGRSREPGALSYSSMCFQTDGGKQHLSGCNLESWSSFANYFCISECFCFGTYCAGEETGFHCCFWNRNVDIS